MTDPVTLKLDLDGVTAELSGTPASLADLVARLKDQRPASFNANVFSLRPHEALDRALRSVDLGNLGAPHK